MPFDLARVASHLRARHQDFVDFRHALLDVLFAAGCGVSEQAVALKYGDTLCIRASGPSVPDPETELVVVVVDLEPPHLSNVALAMDKPGQWPPSLASLGGPASALAWVSVVHALSNPEVRRPWRALYFRGPALGLGRYVRSELADVSPRADKVQVVPSLSVSPVAGMEACDLVRLDLIRSRNVWRFPACSHGYALSSKTPYQESLDGLQELLNGLGEGVAWTLHDAHLYHSDDTYMTSVLRCARPLTAVPSWFDATEVDPGRRLMFPINDALAALGELSRRLQPAWGDALDHPLHLHVLPDGLRVFTVTPGTEKQPRLPTKAGSMAAHWHIEPLAVVANQDEEGFSVGDDEWLGPIASGAVDAGARIWRFPSLQTDDDLAGLQRALKSRFGKAL
jgi:hypothetical protein